MSSVEPIKELPLIDTEFVEDTIKQPDIPFVLSRIDNKTPDEKFQLNYLFGQQDQAQLIEGIIKVQKTLELLYNKQKEIITQLNQNTADIEAINEELEKIKQEIEEIKSAIEAIKKRLAILEDPISIESGTSGNINLLDGGEVELLELDTSGHNLPFTLSTNLYTLGNGLVRLEYGGKSLELANNSNNLTLPVFKLSPDVGIIKLTFKAVGTVNADYQLIVTTCGV